MAQSKEPSPQFSLRSILALPLTALILFVALLVATLIGGAGVLLVGRILSQFFGVGVFEAALIALGVALGITYALVRISLPQHVVEPVDEDWEEDEDWDAYEDEKDLEDEEEDIIIPPRSRNDPCPCGSGKKYKHCHGKNA